MKRFMRLYSPEYTQQRPTHARVIFVEYDSIQFVQENPNGRGSSIRLKDGHTFKVLEAPEDIISPKEFFEK